MVTTKSIFGKKVIKISGINRQVNTLDGLPIVDAAKGIDVEVLDKDIKSSRSKDPDRCAFAIACMRFMKAKEVRVHLGRTYVRHNGKWVRYVTPVRLQKEIVAFDRGGSFEPGTYRLMAPAPSHRQGVKKKTGPKNTKAGPKKHGYNFTGNVRESIIHH